MYVDTSCFDPHSARMQRAEGAVRLSVDRRAGATRLRTLFQEGCAKARLPRPVDGRAPEAILINTSGGLTGGDRFAVHVEVGASAELTVTTQACERIYRSTGDEAEVSNQLTVASGARLAWLPQETILFDGGRLSRRLDVALSGDAQFLGVESVLFGRAAMDETLRHGSLHDRWRVRRDGKLLFADDFRVSGDIAARLAKPAALGGSRAMATVLHVGADTERLLAPAREVIGPDGGASAWNGKLLVRVVAASGLVLRRRLQPLLSLLLGGAPLPKVWEL